jgi:ABC-type glutathione transport system ATPase component
MQNRLPPMIQIEGVTKEYDLPSGQSGKLVAADQLSLTITRGEVFGVVGPNLVELTVHSDSPTVEKQLAS